MRDPIWRHLGALTLAAALLALVLYATTWHGRLPSAGWELALLAGLLSVPSALYILLPVAAGIAAGTARLGERGARRALAGLVLVMVVMAALDLWAGPAATRAELVAARSYGAQWPMPTEPTMVRLAERVGELGVVARLVTGGLPGVDQTARTYPFDHPRAAAAEAIPHAALLLAPFILMGLVLGAAAWVRRRVIFRAPRDEAVARWVTAWVLAPAGLGLIGMLASPDSYAVLFRGAPLWRPLVGYIPLLAIALLGWRAAYRAPAADAAALAPGHGV